MSPSSGFSSRSGDGEEAAKPLICRIERIMGEVCELAQQTRTLTFVFSGAFFFFVPFFFFFSIFYRIGLTGIKHLIARKSRLLISDTQHPL